MWGGSSRRVQRAERVGWKIHGMNDYGSLIPRHLGMHAEIYVIRLHRRAVS